MRPASRLSRSRSALFLALALPIAPGESRAEAILGVSGAVVSLAPRLEVRVVVTNRGDRPAVPLAVVAELLGQRREARIAGGVAAGASGTVSLGFEPGAARPGVHALTLLLEHPVEGPPDGALNPPVASQQTCLLLALGANRGEAVRLAADPLQVVVKGVLRVRLESADGAPHRVRLRALGPRGLRAEGDGQTVAVPAKGSTSADLVLVRAGAPRGSRHEVLVLAETLDGTLARADTLAATVGVAPDPSLLPRLRGPLLALGFLLVALALGYEAWHRHPRARRDT